MEWLLFTTAGIAILLYALMRLALVLDAMSRAPTLKDDLRTTAGVRDTSPDGTQSDRIPVDAADLPRASGC